MRTFSLSILAAFFSLPLFAAAPTASVPNLTGTWTGSGTVVVDGNNGVCGTIQLDVNQNSDSITVDNAKFECDLFTDVTNYSPFEIQGNALWWEGKEGIIGSITAQTLQWNVSDLPESLDSWVFEFQADGSARLTRHYVNENSDWKDSTYQASLGRY